jgi:hypothetical protein
VTDCSALVRPKDALEELKKTTVFRAGHYENSIRRLVLLIKQEKTKLAEARSWPWTTCGQFVTFVTI